MKKVCIILLIFSVAAIERSHAVSRGDILLTVTTGNYFYTDHNNCAAGGGPRAAYLGVQVRNASGSSQDNITVELVKYTDYTNYALVGGQAAVQSLATLPANARDTLFWYSTYPCITNGGSVYPTGVIFKVTDMDNATSYLDTLYGLSTDKQISSNGGGLVGTSALTKQEGVGGLFCFRCDYNYPKLVAGDIAYLQPTTNLAFDAGSYQLESAVVLSSTANSSSCIPVGNCPLNYNIGATCGTSGFDMSVEYCFRIKSAQTTVAYPYNSATSGAVGLKYVITSVPVYFYPADPLPVELTYFTATAAASSVQLYWQTASEFNTSHFELQRSEDGIHFYPVYVVEAAHFSDVLTDYQYEDRQPLEEGYYRLMITDYDGTIQYSLIRSVKLAAEITDIDIQLYPNPAQHAVHVSFSMQPPTGILQLYAVNGAMLEAYPVSPESRHVQLDISTISSGMYVLKYTDEFQVITKSFIKD